MEKIIESKVMSDNTGNEIVCPVAGFYTIKAIATANSGYTQTNINLRFFVPGQWVNAFFEINLQPQTTKYIYLPLGYHGAGAKIIYDVSPEVLFAYNFILND